MKRFYSGLFMAAGGVLAGAERLLSHPKHSRRARQHNEVEVTEAPAALPATIHVTPEVPEPVAAIASPQPEAKPVERNFSIKRTKSEVGYVYWILEGYGRYKCFILCDSWEEAVAQAKAKMAEIDGTNAKVAVAASSLA